MPIAQSLGPEFADRSGDERCAELAAPQAEVARAPLENEAVRVVRSGMHHVATGDRGAVEASMHDDFVCHSSRRFRNMDRIDRDALVGHWVALFATEDPWDGVPAGTMGRPSGFLPSTGTPAASLRVRASSVRLLGGTPPLAPPRGLPALSPR